MQINRLIRGLFQTDLNQGNAAQREGAARRRLFLEGLEQRDLLTTAWGIDKAKLFSIDDYTQLASGAVAAGIKTYSQMKYQNAASGTTANIQPQMKAFALDANGIGYMSYHGDLTFTDGQPTLLGPILLKIDTKAVTTAGPNVVTIVGKMTLPAGASTSAIEGLSFDPISGNLFGSVKVSGADKLIKVSTANAAITEVGLMQNAALGAIVDNAADIEFDEFGNLYVSDTADDDLYTVNPATGAIIAVVDNNVGGGLGQSTDTYVEALGWDPTLNQLVGIDDIPNLFFKETLDGVNGNNIPLGIPVPPLDSPSSIKFPPAPSIDIEKTTDGTPNGNLTDSDFNNEDGPDGAGVPVLTPGSTVTWTYQVTNTGTTAILLGNVTVTDSVPGVTPVRDPSSDTGSDGVLSPSEKWIYKATGTVLDLGMPAPAGVTTVIGCTNIPAGSPGRNTYVNTGKVSIPGATDSDLSHYCNPAPKIDIEKTTDGSPNGNPTDSGFDNEDSPNGAGVPVLTPGTAVTWTYRVTNTGTVTIPLADVTVTDSVPGVTLVRDVSSDTGNDSLLSPGERWIYKATGTVLDLGKPVPSGVTTVIGCANIPTGTLGRNTYVNTGRVSVPGSTDTDNSHYCNPAPKIDIEKTTDGSPNGNPTDSNFDNEDSANGAGVPVLNLGTTATWTYEVTNTGLVTIPLADVTVTDSVPGVNPVRDPSTDVGSDGLLSPGEKWRYRTTGAVLDLSGTVPAGVTIVTGCTNIPAGSPGRNTYENNGKVTIPGATDNDLSHYCNPPPAPKIDIEKTTDGSPNGNSTDSNFDNEDGPNGAGVPVLTPGSTATWTYQVTNTGTTAILLADVTVTDSVPGVTPVRDPSSDTGSDGVLSPGEKWIYKATGTVLDLGKPAPAGVTTVIGCANIPAGSPGRNTYVNTGKVSIPGASDSDPSHYCNPAPKIDIEKTTDGSPNGNPTDSNFDNEDSPNGAGVPVLNPGSTATWTYQVTNTGVVTIPLADVTVTDSVPGVTLVRDVSSDTGSDSLLSPGERWIYKATGTVLDLGNPAPGGVTTVIGCANIPSGTPGRNTYVNTGKVSVPGSTDEDKSHYCNPAPKIDIEKTTDGSPNGNSTDSNFDNEDSANGAGVPVLNPGTAATWTYEVTNTGVVTIPLADVTVTDSVPGVNPVRDPSTDLGSDSLLSPGEKWRYRATGTVLDLNGTVPVGVTIVTGCANIPAGSPSRNTYENNGKVTIPGATDNDLSHYCNPAPKIDIEKTTDGSPNGNATDSNFDNEDGPNGAGVPVLTPGSTATWTYQVTNTGTTAILLADVTVTDSVPGVTPVRDPSSDTGSDGLLSPGERWIYKATGTVLDLGKPAPAGVTTVIGCVNIPAGSPGRNTYVNTGKVSIPGATDSDLSHYCNPAPKIDIEKTTDGSPNGNSTDSNFDNEDSANGAGVPVLNPGTTATWTYEVTNIGSVTIPLADVTVTDSVPGVNPVRDPSTDAGSDSLLSPGEKWIYKTTGTVLNLSGTVPAGVTIVTGCTGIPAGAPGRNTYENNGKVTIPGSTDSDLSHYCNPPPVQPIIDIEKFVAIEVPPPPTVDLCPTSGKPESMTWKYVPSNTFNPLQPVPNKAVVLANNGLDDDNTAFIVMSNSATPGSGTIFFQGLVNVGDTFVASGSFGANSFLHFFDSQGGPLLQSLQYHTSCSAPIILGAQALSATLVGYDGLIGGPVTLPPSVGQFSDADTPADAIEVDVGDTLLFRYVVTNPGTVPMNNVNLADDGGLGPDFNPTRGPDIVGNNDNVLAPGEQWLYTATGTVAGSDCNIGTASGNNVNSPFQLASDSDSACWKIEEIRLTKFVAVEPQQVPTVDLCPTAGKPESMTFKYVPSNTFNPLQPIPNKAMILANNGLDDDNTAFIVMSNSATPGSGTIFFQGLVNVGETFVASGAFGANSFLHFFDSQGGPLLQSLQYHTSCSAPIILGAQVLSATLVGYDGVNGGPVTPPGGQFGDTDPPGPTVLVGQNVVFTFVVTNPGNQNLSDVQLVDSQPGLTITRTNNGTGNDEILSPGETWIYSATITATDVGAKTNTATVSGKAPGNVVVSDTDSAFYTVEILKFYVVDNSDETFRYTPSGALINSSSLAADNKEPRGIATDADGTPVWVIDKNKNVYVYDATGNSLGSWKARKTAAENKDVSDKVQGIATDGTDVWIVDDDKNEVYYYAGGAAWRDNAVPRNATSKFTLNTANANPRDIVVGTIGATRYLWVVDDNSTDKVFRYQLNANNTVQATVSWTINSANSKPRGITLDPSGASQDIWIVDDGSSVDKVFRYANGKNLTSGTAPAATSFSLTAANSAPQGIADPLLKIVNVAPVKQTNPNNRFDVNGDGLVTPVDVLNVFNKLNSDGAGALELGEGEDPTSWIFYDVNGDGLVTPIDGLQVVNYLNTLPLEDVAAIGSLSGTGAQPDDGESSPTEDSDAGAIIDAALGQLDDFESGEVPFAISEDDSDELQQLIDELFADVGSVV